MNINSVIEDIEWKILQKKATVAALKNQMIKDLAEAYIRELELIVIDLRYAEAYSEACKQTEELSFSV